jgi:hypothetical protein
MMEEHHTLSLPHIFKHFRYTTETQVYGSWRVKTIFLYLFLSLDHIPWIMTFVRLFFLAVLHEKKVLRETRSEE